MSEAKQRASRIGPIGSRFGFRARRDVRRLANGFRAGVHEKSDNKTVQTQDFSENEDQNHSDVKTRLLSSSTDTGVADNTNSETSSKTGQTDSKTGAELDESSVQGELLGQVVGDQDRDDQTVDTNDTSHDNGDNVLNNQIGAEDTHAANTDTSLGGTIGSAEAGEDDGGRAAQRTEEGRVDGAKFCSHFNGIGGSDGLSMGA